MIFLRMFSSWRWVFTTLFVLAGAALCIRLGIWQLDRLEQRRAFNAHYEEMRAASVINMPQDASKDLMDMEYRAIMATGVFDFDHQVALRNQYYRDQYGYKLLTPLVMADGTAILVDRGWVPAEGNDTREGWAAFDAPEGEVTVTGIIRLSRVEADFTGQTDPTPMPGQRGLDVWLFPNLPRMQEQLPYLIAPVYIQVDVDATDIEPPIATQPTIEITEGPHFGYALQWFTFATILLLGYPFFVRSQTQSND